MRTHWISVALLALTVSCSTVAPSATDSPAMTSPTSATVSPSEPGSAAPATLSTSTVAPTTEIGSVPYSTARIGYGPAPLPGSDGAGGSGCAPGNEELPDGAWFGFVVDRSDVGIQFDLACWWSGDRANEVALEHGEAEVPVPNDYYITNDSERLRAIEIAPDKQVAHLDYTEANASGNPYVNMTFGEWGGLNDYLNCDFGSGNEFCPVWLYINDGIVTEMAEQYVP